MPECGWSKANVSSGTAYRHVKDAHPGLIPHTLTRKQQGNKMLAAEEAKAQRQARAREASRRYRAKERRRRAKKATVPLPGEHSGRRSC